MEISQVINAFASSNRIFVSGSLTLREIKVDYIGVNECKSYNKTLRLIGQLDETMCCAKSVKLENKQEPCFYGFPLVCRQQNGWELQGLQTDLLYANCWDPAILPREYCSMPRMLEWIRRKIAYNSSAV